MEAKNKIKELQKLLQFNKEMNNKGLVSILKSRINKLQKLNNK